MVWQAAQLLRLSLQAWTAWHRVPGLKRKHEDVGFQGTIFVMEVMAVPVAESTAECLLFGCVCSPCPPFLCSSPARRCLFTGHPVTVLFQTWEPCTVVLLMPARPSRLLTLPLCDLNSCFLIKWFCSHDPQLLQLVLLPSPGLLASVPAHPTPSLLLPSLK